MTSRECKQTILKILNDARLNALRSDRRATAAHAAEVVGHDVWHKVYPDVSGCPYDVRRAEVQMGLSRTGHKRMQEIYQFAIDTFID